MVLFRFILILILLYLIISFIGRVFFASVVKKARNNMNAQQSQQYRDSRKEGEVTVEGQKPDGKKRIDNDEGEYVKYEEVKD